MESILATKRLGTKLIFLLIVITGVWYLSYHNYLLFHTGVELFSIVIAFSGFVIALNTHHLTDNQFLIFIGLAYGFIAGFDLLHALAYQGLGVFPSYGANLPTQIWVIGRYLESSSLLVGCLFFRTEINHYRKVIIGYLLLSTVLLVSLFYWELIPNCFIPGEGLTLFKVVSEYLFIVILAAASLVLKLKRSFFSATGYRYLQLAIWFTALSSLFFTLYVDVYGLFNMLGHLVKVVSFYFIYKSLIELSFRRPYENLFSRLKEKNDKLELRIEQGKEIHQSLLPPEELNLDNLSAAVFYRPAEELGGDFFNFYHHNGRLVFYLADVTGHGLDGAMLNLLVQEKLNNYFGTLSGEDDYAGYQWLLEDQTKTNKLTPHKIIDQVSELYEREEFSAEYFLCFQVGSLDLRSGDLAYSNAGFHIPPYYLSASGRVEALEATGLPISGAVDFKSADLIEQRTDLNPGDKLVLTTDGLIEVEAEQEKYGTERLKEVMRNHYYLDCQLLKDRIIESLHRFKGAGDRQDDITFLILEQQADKYQTRLESDCSELAEFKEEVRDFLVDRIEKLDFLLIGLDEIVANAIRHGNQSAADKQVTVEIVVREEYIRIGVADEGSGFDWRDSLEVEIDPQDFTDGGRGLAIARQVFDRVVYNSIGNRVNLIKFRGGHSDGDNPE